MPEKLKRDPACTWYKSGWVERSDTSIRRIVLSEYVVDILDRPMFKEGVDRGYWPNARKTEIITDDPPNTPRQHKGERWKISGVYDVDKITFINRFTEWAPKQFVDALKLICDICVFCQTNKVWIPYAHLWNVTIHRGSLIYMDIGDFRLRHPRAREITCSITDSLAAEPTNNTPVPLSRYVVNHEEIRDLIYESIRKHQKRGEFTEIFQESKKILDLCKLTMRDSRWNRYLGKKKIPDKDEMSQVRDMYGNKSSVIYDTIEKIKPKTMMDFSCNSGLYSFLAASMGSSVVGIDTCAPAIEWANDEAARRDVDCAFLCFDATKKIEQYGPRNQYGTPESRLQCDMLVAPAISHHLGMQGHGPEAQAKLFSGYAKKNLLVEYIPDNDKWIQKDFKKTKYKGEWFSIEQYCDALYNEGWKNFQVFESNPSTRSLILCER